jgi:hypothetical protein
MKKKILIFALLFSTSVVILPGVAYSSVGTAVSKLQIRVEIGRRHDRGLHRGWYRGRRMAWYNYDRGSGWTRQVYYIDGRPYYRWVRYNF